VNQAPRKTTKGTPGEKRRLHLELKLLADVGLVGEPNAGKSTLLATVSNAKPKRADYPFTTLTPHLGVVRHDQGESFVMADLPGLIEGAAQGAGLGIQFLRHVTRCKLLLQLVDISSRSCHEICSAVKQITAELSSYDQSLLQKTRWLVFTKADVLTNDEAEQKAKEIVSALAWQEPWFVISAVAEKGLQALNHALWLSLLTSEPSTHEIPMALPSDQIGLNCQDVQDEG